MTQKHRIATGCCRDELYLVLSLPPPEQKKQKHYIKHIFLAPAKRNEVNTVGKIIYMSLFPLYLVAIDFHVICTDFENSTFQVVVFFMGVDRFPSPLISLMIIEKIRNSILNIIFWTREIINVSRDWDETMIWETPSLCAYSWIVIHLSDHTAISTYFELFNRLF